MKLHIIHNTFVNELMQIGYCIILIEILSVHKPVNN